jgi:hypothetical protein
VTASWRLSQKLSQALVQSITALAIVAIHFNSMAYLASIHRPSSVRHALKLNFLSAQDDTLVVA